MPDDLDNSAAGGVTTPSSSEPSTDTASTGSVTTDTPSSAPTANGTSGPGGSALADTPKDDGAQPSLTGGAEADAVDQKIVPKPANPYEKQYRDVQGWATKVHQQNLELQRQMKALQEQFSAAQQKAAKPESRPWDPEDPRHPQFRSLVERARYFDELLQGEQNPEIVKALQQRQHQILGAEGIKTLQEWREDVRRQEYERQLNPKAFYAKLIREQAQPVVQETLQSTSQHYEKLVQARDQAKSWIQGNPEVATQENIRAVIGMMEKGISFEMAAAQVERDHYRNQVSTAKKMAASAGEKERLLQGNAAGGINRNPNASKRVDVGKVRKDKGIEDGRAFTDLLFELDKEGLL
jgi:hypothetical protein